MKVIQVPNHTLNYVALVFNIRAGSAFDPPGKEGLAYATANMLQRGTARFTREQVADELDFVGTGISVSVGTEGVQLFADCATTNLPGLLDILGEVLATPRFDAEELEKLKRQTLAEIQEMRDNDSGLASYFFSALVHEGHRYGPPARGYETSIATLTRQDVVDFYERHYRRSEFVLGLAGDIGPGTEAQVLEATVGRLPAGRPFPRPAPVPPGPNGLDILLVTKPERSQAQVAIGQKAVPGSDPRFLPATVAVTGFGGTFTSVLVREIREKRGWSYGVGAALAPGRYTGTFRIRYAPKLENVAEAIQLTLDLLAGLRDDGLEPEHLDFARSYLVNQHPFSIDTPVHRLDYLLTLHLTGRPESLVDRFTTEVRSIADSHASSALASFLTPDRSRIVVVGDVSLQELLGKLPGIARMRTVPFDHDGPLPDGR
jgi:zinc protease